MPDPRRRLISALIEAGTALLMAYVAAPESFRSARPWAWRTTLRAAGAGGRLYGRGGMAAELAGDEHRAQRAYAVAERLTALSLGAESRYRRSVGQ